jgi:hypothetical protein
MNLHEFKQTLNANANHEILIEFDSGQQVAPHFHVTEVGKVTKDFVDCGGTRRSTVSCVLQTLVANDFDHRLNTDKLATIIEKAAVLGLDDDLPVEAEVQTETIGVFAFSDATATDGQLVLKLASKQTACLAPDKCGLDVLPVAGQSDCCGETGCC